MELSVLAMEAMCKFGQILCIVESDDENDADKNDQDRLSIKY
jgi:hypothetical protein